MRSRQPRCPPLSGHARSWSQPCASGRNLIAQRVLAGHMPGEVAKQAGVSRQTVYKWVRRFQAEGQAGLADRSSRPHRSPNRTSTKVRDLPDGVGPVAQFEPVSQRRARRHTAIRAFAHLLLRRRLLRGSPKRCGWKGTTFQSSTASDKPKSASPRCILVAVTSAALPSPRPPYRVISSVNGTPDNRAPRWPGASPTNRNGASHCFSKYAPSAAMRRAAPSSEAL